MYTMLTQISAENHCTCSIYYQPNYRFNFAFGAPLYVCSMVVLLASKKPRVIIVSPLMHTPAIQFNFFSTVGEPPGY